MLNLKLLLSNYIFDALLLLSNCRKFFVNIVSNKNESLATKMKVQLLFSFPQKSAFCIFQLFIHVFNKAFRMRKITFYLD